MTSAAAPPVPIESDSPVRCRTLGDKLLIGLLYGTRGRLVKRSFLKRVEASADRPRAGDR